MVMMMKIKKTLYNAYGSMCAESEGGLGIRVSSSPQFVVRLVVELVCHRVPAV